jgi:amidase
MTVDVIETSIIELQDLMSSGAASSESIVETYLEKIDDVDVAGPSINSIIEINPDVLEIAQNLDRERKANGPRSLLHGIPIVLKDNIDTGDNMSTTAGSLALNGHKSSSDALLVTKLRNLGAVILAKSNLSEWANFRSTKPISGWSSKGGRTLNPYVLDRSPRGSSAGSAVAVAANLCAVAIGTETDGSIMCPSSATCTVGIKPTVGLVSQAGIVPISHSQDTAGPIARTVSDAAIILGATSELDRMGDLSTKTNDDICAFYTDNLRLDGLEGVRVGIVRNPYDFGAWINGVFDDAVAHIAYLGASIVDPIEVHNVGELLHNEMEVLLYEFKAGINSYLESHNNPAGMGCLSDIINYNEKNSSEVMKYFGQELFIMAEEKGNLDSKKYLEAKAQNMRLAGEEGLNLTIQQHNLDAVVVPTGGLPWVVDILNGDCSSGHSCRPAAVSGYPSISVPAGYVGGLPVGISFIGQPYQEAKLIKMAFAYEQSTNVRRPPEFLKEASI